MSSGIFAALLILASLVACLFLKVKTVSYNFTNKYFEICKGIVSRDQESTDLVDVDDEKIHRNLLDRLLGVANVTVWSKRDKDNGFLVISGLCYADAEKVLDYIRIHSYRNYTDYRLAQDFYKQNGGSGKEDPGPDVIDPDTRDHKE